MINLTEEMEFKANRRLNTKPHLLTKECLGMAARISANPNGSGAPG